jgi:hypothetical protein
MPRVQALVRSRHPTLPNAPSHSRLKWSVSSDRIASHAGPLPIIETARGITAAARGLTTPNREPAFAPRPTGLAMPASTATTSPLSPPPSRCRTRSPRYGREAPLEACGLVWDVAAELSSPERPSNPATAYGVLEASRRTAGFAWCPRNASGQGGNTPVSGRARRRPWRPRWAKTRRPGCKKGRGKLAPRRDATRSNAPQSAVACCPYSGSEE